MNMGNIAKDMDTLSKLSLLRIQVAFNAVHANILSFTGPASPVGNIRTGAFLLPGKLQTGACAMETPIKSAPLSRMQKLSANRRANVILGLIGIAHIVTGGRSPRYLLLTPIRIAVVLLIRRVASALPKPAVKADLPTEEGALS